jgi:hypothetical protein
VRPAIARFFWLTVDTLVDTAALPELSGSFLAKILALGNVARLRYRQRFQKVVGGHLRSFFSMGYVTT